MRIAITTWQGRIAPVFDVAGHVLLVEVEGGRVAGREQRQLEKRAGAGRAAELAQTGAEVLICGAISAAVQRNILARGVRVIAFVCGGVEEVLAAYLEGGVAARGFAMPGCQRWRRRGGEDVLPGAGAASAETEVDGGNAAMMPGREKLSGD